MKSLKFQTGYIAFICIFFLTVMVMIFFARDKSLSGATRKLPGAGYVIPAFSIPAPEDRPGKAYLKLGEKSEFSPAELKTPLLLIEVLNVYCASCQFMRPYMNELFDRIEKDRQLSNKIKLIGICAGNDKWDVAAKQDSYRFPLIPDRAYDFHDLVGKPPTPFLIFARPYKNGSLLVVHSHLGRMDNSDDLFSLVQTAIKKADTIQPEIKAAKERETVTELAVPISEGNLMKKIKQSLSTNEDEPGNIKKIVLPSGVIYAGTMKSGKTAFAVVVARKIPCADCHDVFFIYSFEDNGKFLNFIPISISKAGNIQWNKDDVDKVHNRLKGVSLLNKIPFNSKVDGVTSATISSELIFDSIGKTGKIVDDLIKLGYVRERK